MKKEEFHLQCQIITLLSKSGFQAFAIPNGGSRNLFEAFNLKRSGVRAGVADLMVLLKDKVVFVELKTPTGKQSIHQKKFQEECEKKNLTYLLWRSIEDCQDFINKYKDLK